MKRIFILLLLLGLSSCSKEEFDYSNINEIDNLIVNSKFNIELIDSLYNTYEENDYLEGLREIVYLYNSEYDNSNNVVIYPTPDENYETYTLTSVCFARYFMDYPRFASLLRSFNKDGSDFIFIGTYSTFLNVDIGQEI